MVTISLMLIQVTWSKDWSWGRFNCPMGCTLYLFGKLTVEFLRNKCAKLRYISGDK